MTNNTRRPAAQFLAEQPPSAPDVRPGGAGESADGREVAAGVVGGGERDWWWEKMLAQERAESFATAPALVGMLNARLDAVTDALEAAGISPAIGGEADAVRALAERLADSEAECARMGANLEQMRSDYKALHDVYMDVDSRLADSERRFGEVELALSGEPVNPEWCRSARTVRETTAALSRALDASDERKDRAVVAEAECDRLRALAGDGRLVAIAETGRRRKDKPVC